ncbi:MAG: FAD/NAD(P)-binding protein [Pseudomonadota bacterium]|nr:FAD/NAD(P)-binding protein [Pseudomonadota bacterium]
MFRRIAIIGGGAAAAAMLSELLEYQPAKPLHLDWYTGGAGSVRGAAYGTPDDQHLLNVRVASMGMFGGRSRGFLDFLQRDDPAVSGTDFLPRRRYGDYLEAEVKRILELGKARGHDVKVIPFAVDSMVPERGAVTVLHGEETREVDAAVLAIGAMPPRALRGVSAEALDSRRYVIDPWPLLAHAGEHHPVPEHVLVIGTGLTAVDVLLSLSRQWPQARFTAVSRHGLLPEAHLRTAAMPAGDGTELIEAMQDVPDVRRWMQLLRDAIAQGGEWRAIIDGLRPFTPMLWAELAPEQRSRFVRHVRWAWDRVRHRMPPENAEAMAALVADGRLDRQTGRLQSVTLIDNGLQVTTHHAGSARVQVADLVIQASGLNHNVLDANHRLMNQLLTNAHVKPDPLDLGLCGSVDGHLRHDGTHWPHFFAIGSLLRGALWESTAMPEIRRQARNISRQLLID